MNRKWFYRQWRDWFHVIDHQYYWFKLETKPKGPILKTKAKSNAEIQTTILDSCSFIGWIVDYCSFQFLNLSQFFFYRYIILYFWVRRFVPCFSRALMWCVAIEKRKTIIIITHLILKMNQNLHSLQTI